MEGSPVKDLGNVSSYAFRRWFPAWAGVRKLPYEERQCLGNWREAPKGAVQRDPASSSFSSSMGLRYAGRKDDSAELAKLENIIAFRLAVSNLDTSLPVTWKSVRSAVPDKSMIEQRAAKIWQDSGDLVLSALGRSLDVAPRPVEVFRTEAVSEVMPALATLAGMGAAA